MRNVKCVQNVVSVKSKMSQIYLFTSKSCIHCSAEKEYLIENNIDFTEIDVQSSTFEYLQRDLLRNGIILRYVPAIIKNDGNKMIMIERGSLL